jgi:hypothetical protein
VDNLAVDALDVDHSVVGEEAAVGRLAATFRVEVRLREDDLGPVGAVDCRFELGDVRLRGGAGRHYPPGRAGR